MLGLILKSRGNCSAQQMGEMLYQLYLGLGSSAISLAHREVLVGSIRASGHEQEIAQALQAVEGGQDIVDFLLLGTPPL